MKVLILKNKTKFYNSPPPPPPATAAIGPEASRSHSDTLHSVAFLWRSDHPLAVTSTGNTQHSQETDILAPGAGFEPALTT